MATDNFWLISKQNKFYLCSLIPINTILQANDACFSLEASKRKIRPYYIYSSFVCFFVCLWFFVQSENFSLIWRRHNYWWKAANFDLCSALIAIEQWRFFSVPHLLWHGASSPRTRDTHTNWSAFLYWSCQYLFLRLRFVTSGIRTPNIQLAGCTL